MLATIALGAAQSPVGMSHCTVAFIGLVPCAVLPFQYWTPACCMTWLQVLCNSKSVMFFSL